MFHVAKVRDESGVTGELSSWTAMAATDGRRLGSGLSSSIVVVEKDVVL